MLILTRKAGERVWLTQGDLRIEVVVMKIQGKQVRLGFVCPEAVSVDRLEVYARKAAEGG